MATVELTAAGNTRPVPAKVCRRCGRQGEWPGQPCPTCKQGLDAVPLHVLGEHLRDQKWLDLRVDDSRGQLVKRVRFTSIVVRPHDEMVTCRQEWLGGMGDDVEFVHQNLAFDADAIWGAAPTVFDVETLDPYGISAPFKRPMPYHLESMFLIETICSVVGSHYGFSPVAIRNYSPKDGATEARHVAILLLHDMTTMSRLEVAQVFGYKSQMPVQTARVHIAQSASAAGELHKLVLQVDAKMSLTPQGIQRRLPAATRLFVA